MWNITPFIFKVESVEYFVTLVRFHGWGTTNSSIYPSFVPPLTYFTSRCWKALVQPILDYCSQLWCPIRPGQIKQLEEIQKNFTRKISLGEKLNYWDRLKQLRLFSQEGRRERYRVIYIWKILENLVPPLSDADNGGQVKLHSRIGRTTSLPAMNNKCPQAIQRIRDSSLAVHGAKLFNCLPRSIRDVTKCATLEFKATLDKFCLPFLMNLL